MIGMTDTIAPASRARADQVSEAKHAQREEFDRYYHMWIHVRAEMEDPDSDDEEIGDACRRLDELARHLLTMPAPFLWMVIRKFEVFEEFCGFNHGTLNGDARELIGLGGIKADLICLEKGA